jgi:hypothetical protein
MEPLDPPPRRASTRTVVATAGAGVAWVAMAAFLLRGGDSCSGSVITAVLLVVVWLIALAFTALFVAVAVGNRPAWVIVPVSVFLVVALSLMAVLTVLACG